MVRVLVPDQPTLIQHRYSVTVANNAPTSVLGELAALDPATVGGNVMLTCKTIDEDASDGALYCYINNGVYKGIVGGCCADEVACLTTMFLPTQLRCLRLLIVGSQVRMYNRLQAHIPHLTSPPSWSRYRQRSA